MIIVQIDKRYKSRSILKPLSDKRYKMLSLFKRQIFYYIMSLDQAILRLLPNAFSLQERPRDQPEGDSRKIIQYI